MESTHKVVARFGQPEEARQAMVELETKGIDADAIHIATPSRPGISKDAVLGADLDTVTRLGTKTIAGAAIGAIVGATAVIVALLIFRVEPLGTALVVGGVGGAAGGALIGAYWSLVLRLPANEEAFDTAVVVRHTASQVVLEIRLDDPGKEADAVAVLRRHHVQEIDREVA